MTWPKPSKGGQEIIFMWYSQPTLSRRSVLHSAVTSAT